MRLRFTVTEITRRANVLGNGDLLRVCLCPTPKAKENKAVFDGEFFGGSIYLETLLAPKAKEMKVGREILVDFTVGGD
jgi:hypothetical protein